MRRLCLFTECLMTASKLYSFILNHLRNKWTFCEWWMDSSWTFSVIYEFLQAVFKAIVWIWRSVSVFCLSHLCVNSSDTREKNHWLFFSCVCGEAKDVNCRNMRENECDSLHKTLKNKSHKWIDTKIQKFNIYWKSTRNSRTNLTETQWNSWMSLPRGEQNCTTTRVSAEMSGDIAVSWFTSVSCDFVKGRSW